MMKAEAQKLLDAARVKTVKDVPKGPHFAVVLYKTTSVFHEGDERSRTNPGHGYPEYTETIHTADHYVFTDKTKWEAAVVAMMNVDQHRTDFVAFAVSGVASPTVNVSVSVKLGLM